VYIVNNLSYKLLRNFRERGRGGAFSAVGKQASSFLFLAVKQRAKMVWIFFIFTKVDFLEKKKKERKKCEKNSF